MAEPLSNEASVNVLNPDGKLVSIPSSQAQDAAQFGYTPANDKDIANFQKQEKYGTLGQQLKTGLEGGLEAATFGASDLAENALFHNQEDRMARREVNPGSHAIGAGLGLVGSSALLPGAGAAGVMEGAGTGLAEALGLGAEGASAVSRIGAQTVKSATEMALFQTGDEVSKMLSNDPHQSLQTAIGEIGLSAVLGGAGGAVLGSINPIWEATKGSKVGQFVSDFKGRIGEHLGNLSPAQLAEDAPLAQTAEAAADPAMLRQPPKPLSDEWLRMTPEQRQMARGMSPEEYTAFRSPGASAADAVADTATEATTEQVSKAAEPLAEGLTPGAKMADALIKHGLAKVSGKALGAAVGGTLGHFLGVGGPIGAILGERALAPFFDSVLPGIAKSVLASEGSAGGFKAAIDYAMAVVKGENLLTQVTKDVFKPGLETIGRELLPDERRLDKLDQRLQHLQVNNEDLFKVGGKTGEYLPEHGMAIAQTASEAVNYLNSLRPVVDKKNPLDDDIEPNAIQKQTFRNALEIAEQPLVVVNQIKSGTISPESIKSIKALYPSLYQRLNEKLMNNMIESIHKGNKVPYKTRLGLSMFMGQPLDSTMTPESIQAVQSHSSGMTSQQKEAAAPNMGHPHSMKNINKLPQGYATPNQAREMSRSMKS